MNVVNDISGWEASYRKRRSGECKPHQDAEFLDDLFRKHQVKRILDLGCGDGRHLVYFGKRGYKMYGLDYAPTGLHLAEEWLVKEGLSAKLVCADMSAIPWVDSFFDAVICVKVINHHRIEGIRQTIREIYRVLRPEGWLFLNVSTTRPTGPFKNGVEVEPNTYVLSEGHEKGVPHHFFDREELLNEFSKFDIVDLHQDNSDRTCMLAQKPCNVITDESG